MENYIYLVKNGDLYNIGVVKTIEICQKDLNPGKVIAYSKVENADFFCQELYKRYSDVRLPQSIYFRLNKSQVNDCKFMLSDAGKRDYFEPIFSGFLLAFTFFSSWLLISLLIIYFFIQPVLNKIL